MVTSSSTLSKARIQLQEAGGKSLKSEFETPQTTRSMPACSCAQIIEECPQIKELTVEGHVFTDLKTASPLLGGLFPGNSSSCAWPWKSSFRIELEDSWKLALSELKISSDSLTKSIRQLVSVSNNDNSRGRDINTLSPRVASLLQRSVNNQIFKDSGNCSIVCSQTGPFGG